MESARLDTNLYLGNVIDSFTNGVQLDLRVRLAVDFIRNGKFTDADEALDCASRLLELAQQRGLLKPMPDTGELPVPFKRHVERAVRAQVLQQTLGQEILQENAPAVMPARGNGPLPPRLG